MNMDLPLAIHLTDLSRRGVEYLLAQAVYLKLLAVRFGECIFVLWEK
jgi:hypothetical protein